MEDGLKEFSHFTNAQGPDRLALYPSDVLSLLV